MRRLETFVVLIVLLAIVAPTRASATHEIVQVTSDTVRQGDGQTDGSYVVWSRDIVRGPDPDDHDSDVIAYELVTGATTTVAGGTARQYGARIDNGIVVWEELGWETRNDIRGKDLLTGREFDVAVSDAEERSPRISGNWVIWSQFDIHTSQYSLMARNIATLADPIVITIGEVFGLEIDDDRIVWAEYGSPEPNPGDVGRRLLSTTLGSSDIQVIAEAVVFWLGIDLDGDQITYFEAPDDENAAESQRLIVVNAKTGATTRIDTSGFGVNTSGRYLVWQRFVDINAPAGQVRLGLWGYDLLTQSEFQITDDANPSLNYVSDTRHGLVVWSRGDGDFNDIYVARIRDLLPTARRLNPTEPRAATTWFPETGHYLGYGFRDFWNDNGALPVFGYPLTEEFTEHNADIGGDFTVQYFERERFEWHAENAGTPYEVLLGRLGAELLERQGRDWRTFPTADPGAAHYMPETGHAIAPEFWEFWSGHGLDFGDEGTSFRESLALFGYPLSEPMIETNADNDTVLTQYFERAVFEFHPDNPADYRVLLRRLGEEEMTARGW